jgi:hypothetical protein
MPQMAGLSAHIGSSLVHYEHELQRPGFCQGWIEAVT